MKNEHPLKDINNLSSLLSHWHVEFLQNNSIMKNYISVIESLEIELNGEFCLVSYIEYSDSELFDSLSESSIHIDSTEIDNMVYQTSINHIRDMTEELMQLQGIKDHQVPNDFFVINCNSVATNMYINSVYIEKIKDVHSAINTLKEAINDQ